MKKAEVLDDVMVLNRNEDILLTVRWWEKKRLVYNIILIVFQISIMFPFWRFFTEISSYHQSLSNPGWFLLFFNFSLNVFYCLGVGVEIFFLHYIGKEINKTIRLLLLSFIFIIPLYYISMEFPRMFHPFFYTIF